MDLAVRMFPTVFHGLRIHQPELATGADYFRLNSSQLLELLLMIEGIIMCEAFPEPCRYDSYAESRYALIL